MTFRTRFLAGVCLWIAVVTAVLVALPLALRDRLPDPVAAHWNFSGAPDDAMPFGWLLGIQLVTWLVFAGAGLGALSGSGIARRSRRAWATVLLSAGGGFVLGLTVLSTWANLDVGEWRAARSLNWQVLAVLVCCVAMGWLGWFVASFGPDERPAKAATPAIEGKLDAGENVVWVSVTANPALRIVALAPAVLLVAGVLGSAAVLDWFGSASVGVLIALGLSSVVLLALCSARVQVDRGGVRIAVGPARWPRRRIALARIESASVEQRRPRHVGGWGYRGLPGNATIMVRGGQCLVLHYHGGGELGVSVDDAERGAALINALLAEGAGAGR